MFRGSTVLYGSVRELDEVNRDPLKLTTPAYGRFGTPVSRLLEEALSELEGGAGTVLTNSGLSAVTTTLMAMVMKGDHILVTDSAYYPTRTFCQFLENFGVEVEFYDPCLGEGIGMKIRPNTRLIFMESPGSGTFEVQDIPAIVKVAQGAGVSTVIDNTWATPLFFKPLKLGVDVSIHAGTKYLGGHSDVFLGAIICREPHYARIREAALTLGQFASPEDVHLSLRGLRTLSVRLKEHARNALKTAEWLSTRHEVDEVLYPALPGSRGHELWKRDFTGASGLLGFVLKPSYDKASVERMVDGMRLFGIGHSWGGFESLIVPGHPEAFRNESWKRGGALIRIHVGLEDVEDLKVDLEQGLARLQHVP